MRVGGARYDVRMIETYAEARDAVEREMQPLVDQSRTLSVSDFGLEDEHGWLVPWGVCVRVDDAGRAHFEPPLPGAATFVDRLTGFVSLTSFDAEMSRIQSMQPVRVE